MNIAKAKDFSDINVNSLLLTAALEGWNTVGVKILIEDLKANKDAEDRDGSTPLILACQKGSLQVTKLLIDLDCSVDRKTAFGGTALKWGA